MKKLFSTALALLLALCCGSFLLANAAPETNDALLPVVDEAGVLSWDELDALTEHAQAIAAQYPYDIVVYFAADIYYGTAQELADDFYDYNGYGQGSGKDGLVLMVRPDAHDYAFSGHGTGMEMFDEKRMKELEENIVGSLSQGDWYGAAETYLSLCEKDLGGGMPSGGLSPIMVLVDALLGMVLAIIPVGRMKSQLHSVAERHEAVDYVVKDSIRVTRREDKFIKTVVTRSPLKKNSDNGEHTGSSGEAHSGRSGAF